MNLRHEIEVCRQVARRAGELALAHAARGVVGSEKDDHSPVTIADRECERLIVESLAAAFPDDGFLGEEGALAAGTSGRRWIVDPIDGTRDFLRGLPSWSNLIGLEADGEVVLGTCFLPAQGALYWAVRGEGAYLGEQRIRVSNVGRREQAVACLTSVDGLLHSPHGARLLEYLKGFWAVRALGGCLDAALVCGGHAEVWFELSAKPWDLAPFAVIAEEAGARFFNFDGGRSIRGGNAILCVPALESEVRGLLESLAAS